MSDIGVLSTPGAVPSHGRYAVLDGWRGISIVLVLCGHLLPLGPKAWGLNEAVAAAGMALFFTLSGFLITTFLLREHNVLVFLTRRFFRIIPLAWVFCIIVLAIDGADLAAWFAHALFYANLPPFWLQRGTAHLWSLCVEMQFYLGVAAIVAIAGRRGLWALPVLSILCTGWRIATHTYVSIVTWVRVDEILAGCILALVFDLAWRPPPGWTAWPMTLLLAVALLASAHPGSGGLNYARPYLSAALVGTALFNDRTAIARGLKGPLLGYLAKVSYALYVIHGGLVETWLGRGDGWVKYAKRPLLLAVLFASAHLSTHRFESRCIALGQRLSRSFRKEASA